TNGSFLDGYADAGRIILSHASPILPPEMSYDEQGFVHLVPLGLETKIRRRETSANWSRIPLSYGAEFRSYTSPAQELAPRFRYRQWFGSHLWPITICLFGA